MVTWWGSRTFKISLSRGCCYTKHHGLGESNSRNSFSRLDAGVRNSDIGRTVLPAGLWGSLSRLFLASGSRSLRQTLAYSGGPAQGTLPECLPRHRVFSSCGEMGHTGLSPPHSSMTSPATTFFQNKVTLC